MYHRKFKHDVVFKRHTSEFPIVGVTNDGNDDHAVTESHFQSNMGCKLVRTRICVAKHLG